MNKKYQSSMVSVASAIIIGLGAAGAQAQVVFDVGGDGTIGDTTLTNSSGTAVVPAGGGYWTTDGGGDGDGSIYARLDSPTLTVQNAGDVTLTFEHRYNFENDWDGGTVYMSVNGGAWTHVPTNAFTANGYVKVLDSSSAGGPFPDLEDTFTDKSTGYDTQAQLMSIANLGTFATSNTIAIQFRGGWDWGTVNSAPNWEIGTVKVTDSTAAVMLDVDFLDGQSGFTDDSDVGLAGPWTYLKGINKFEIDADALTADRYVPDVAGSVIDLNDAVLEVVLLAGTLDAGDSFTLFDLSGGTTLTGSVGSLRFPGGTWDTSTLETDGTITLLAPPDRSLIYEPFDDLDPNLNGNTPGKGLTGTWSPGESSVADSSLKYGKLKYQGGRAVTNPGDQFDVNGVSPGTTLTDAGLLSDGATLWFSVLIVKHADVSDSTNDRRTYFSLGTGYPDGFDRIDGNSGSGICVAVNKNNDAVQARGWNDGSDGAGGAFGGALDTSVAEGDTFLAVGKITWGVFGTPGSDVFELYLADKDLNLGSPVSTLTGDFDQDGTTNAANAFDTIGFAGGRPQNGVPELDEIRFAATSADVLPLDFLAPVLVTTDNASGDANQRVATFDEEMYVGTGDIRFVNETTPGTNTIPVGDAQIVVTNNTLTINLTTPLTGGETYHIEIDAGALTDRNLNNFAGISDPDLWEFIPDTTPPTVASFGDNTSPNWILINSAGRLVYTVTFDEPIVAGTVEITDFAATAGSAPITVDSVTATGDPAVYEVTVSTLGTTGTLQLEIVSGAVITDQNGNDLVTTTAIPSDNTINVNNPTPNSGSIANDFQGTISSQGNALNSGGNGRYFHVSVNADNAGTGWYSADLPGTGDPAPAGFRKYTGPVVGYKFLGGSNNSLSGIAASGGDDGRITYTTTDVAFDGFDQQQMRIWTINDPGDDIASAAGVAATGFANPNYSYRGISQIDGFVDISGQASGSVHIYYGSYSSTPTVKVILHDNDNVGADIVITDVHSVADGGNGDRADSGENYVAEIDFVSDGIYDVLEYEYTAGNGNGHGAVLTGPDVVSGTLIMLK